MSQMPQSPKKLKVIENNFYIMNDIIHYLGPFLLLTSNCIDQLLRNRLFHNFQQL